MTGKMIGKMDPKSAEDLANKPAVQAAAKDAAMQAANDPEARAAALSYGKNMLSSSKFGGMVSATKDGGGGESSGDLDGSGAAEEVPLMGSFVGGDSLAGESTRARAQDMAKEKVSSINKYCTLTNTL